MCFHLQPGRGAATCALSKVEARQRALNSPEGSSILEFALIAPMFCLLLFAGVDFSRIFCVEMTLQNAVREAGRYAITGNHLPDPEHAGKNLSRVASITEIAQKAALGIDASGIQISSLSGGSRSAGGPGDTVTISLTTHLPLMTPVMAQFFPNGSYTGTVSVSFRNEPFPPSNTL
jgi:Flp pilus assembly protein TadG